MKNITKIALLVALGGGAIVPALAQDNFPDVPENHWAFEALDNLKKDGIVVGYPDGRYRGTRFMTRYEFAVAMNAAYKKLMGMYSGLAARVDALEKAPKSGGNMEGLDDLKADVAKMKGWGDDIDSLKKMAGNFEKQLASLGVDVEQMKKDLDECKKMMGGNHGPSMPISISGDVNAVVFGGNSTSGKVDMNKTGQTWGQDTTGNPSGLTRDYRVYHEIGLKLASNTDSNVKWHADIVFGNLLDAIGSQSQLGGGGGGGFASTGRFSSFDVYINELSASFNDSLLGLGFNAEVGRVGVKVAPYIFQRPDYTPYTDIARWDDGTWKIDGANVGFNFGGASVHVFGGHNVNQLTTSGNEISPLPALNGVAVQSTLGVTVAANIGKIFKGTLAYLWHDADKAPTNAATPNRTNVFGVDGTLSLGPVDINGGYAQSKPSANTSSITQSKNKAYYANADLFHAGALNVGAEYRTVEANYQAAGSWRRIGTFWQPTDIQTWAAMLGYKVSGNLGLSYTGEFGKVNKSTTNNTVESHNIMADYQFNPNWKIKVGYEDVKVKDLGIRQKWTTLGFGYNLGANTTFGFAYEFGDVNNGANGFGAGAAGAYKGGFFSSQLSIKF